MKWLRHQSDFHDNPKGKQIIRKYGMEGVGFWWILCEMVAKYGTEYRLKSRTDWKISVQEITKIFQEKSEEMLNFLADIRSIDKKALLRGDLYIPKMADYSDEYTDKLRRKSRQGTDKVVLQHVTTRKNTIQNNTGDFVFLKDQAAPPNVKLFYQGSPMRWVEQKKRWYVIQNGQWLEWAGNNDDAKKITVQTKS